MAGFKMVGLKLFPRKGKIAVKNEKGLLLRHHRGGILDGAVALFHDRTEALQALHKMCEYSKWPSMQEHKF